ncbi:MAG: hypothetical protein K2Y37_18010 [Pirellulales bacterium]|nr:hypothetical protein [Pirellulales bacterium]
MTREHAHWRRIVVVAASVVVAARVLSSPTAFAEDAPLGPAVEMATIAAGDLSVRFRDNSRSPEVLSGIDALFNTRQAAEFDAFDPDGRGSSAGLNFEHIISGARNPDNKFTPRNGTYTLHALPDGRSVRLVRRAEDCPWKVASTFTYTVTAPHYIDFEFAATPRDASVFGQRGWAICFFANYMHDVADIAIHFRGVAAPGGAEAWIAADAPKQHADWNAGGTYRHVSAPALEYDADHDFRLNNWSYDWPRYTQPFYFGKAAHGMTLLLMFDRAYSERDEIRFSLFKFKVPKQPRPAWDFQYVIHKVEADAQYGFRGRLVWKKFVDADDCWKEYEDWRRATR